MFALLLTYVSLIDCAFNSFLSAFGIGMILTFLVLILENTPYMLNLQVQSIGYYLQWNIFELNFHTDAFAQLREGEGRAIDGHSADHLWLEGWTVFYVRHENHESTVCTSAITILTKVLLASLAPNYEF